MHLLDLFSWHVPNLVDLRYINVFKETLVHRKIPQVTFVLLNLRMLVLLISTFKWIGLASSRHSQTLICIKNIVVKFDFIAQQGICSSTIFHHHYFYYLFKTLTRSFDLSPTIKNPRNI